MKVNEIKLLYEYNYWANHRILAACVRVSPEQYTAPAGIGAGYGSLRTTVLHIVDTEYAWRQLCLGVPEVEWKPWAETNTPTLQSLQEHWQADEQAMRAFIGALSDADLQGLVRYPVEHGVIREWVLWHCLYHVVNHGTQHRSEAAALLTSYGQSPGDIDFTLFLNDHFKLAS
jgi:uncharacterized damage-inducible protein DinB